MRFPISYGQFARVVLEANRFTGDESFQDPKDDLGLVLLMRKYQFRQLSMKCTALRASEPANFDPGRGPIFRPYNSGDHPVILQRPTALGTDRHVYANHILASANLS